MQEGLIVLMPFRLSGIFFKSQIRSVFPVSHILQSGTVSFCPLSYGIDSPEPARRTFSHVCEPCFFYSLIKQRFLSAPCSFHRQGRGRREHARDPVRLHHALGHLEQHPEEGPQPALPDGLRMQGEPVAAFLWCVCCSAMARRHVSSSSSS